MNTLLLNNTAYGTIPAIVDPSDGTTATTPSALSALVIKNGTDTADSVTITAVGGGRTGVYKWSYNPSGEVEGDVFSLVFTITISSVDYYHTVDLIVEAAERGTDSANTTTPPTAAAIRAEMDSNSTQLAAIVEDTGTTLPSTLSGIETKVDTVDGVVDDILVDTGTTLPASLTSISSAITVVDGIVDDILVDTGTTLPATLTTIDTEVGQVLDRAGYCLTILAGTTSTAGTATEQYDLTIDSVAHRAAYTGLDANGNRGTTTLSKP